MFLLFYLKNNKLILFGLKITGFIFMHMVSTPDF